MSLISISFSNLASFVCNKPMNRPPLNP
jgi:hypothetical protein